MPNKRTPLTWDEHVALGKELAALSERMAELMGVCSRAYGVQSRASNRTYRAYMAINSLRSELDERVFAEHRDQTDPDPLRVYYPGPRAEHKS